jgi:hypothetical protein
MKQTYSLLFIAAISAASVITGCQKTVDSPQHTSAPQERISASVQGFVVDENESPVAGALVTAETVTAITDASGKFLLNDVELYQAAGSVKVEKDGYSIASGSYILNEGVSQRVQIRLIKHADNSSANGASFTHKARN